MLQPQPALQQSNPVSSAAAITAAADCSVIGSGNSARALAAYLASRGHRVSIFARRLDSIKEMCRRRSVVVSGEISGEFTLSEVSDKPSCLANTSIIFVATTADAYGDVATKIAPYLSAEHKVILFSSKLGGALAFSQAIKAINQKQIDVLETDALFACRAQADESVWIRGFKRWTLFSACNRSASLAGAKLINAFFPELEVAANPIERGLTDFGALAHAAIVLANMNSVDRGQPFLFYYEGLTERTAKILEKLESEFGAIAAAYGGKLIAMKDLLNRYYGCDNSTLLNAMRSVPNYRHSQSPPRLEHRFLFEDVTCTLVPASQFARLAGFETPVIDAIITFASILTGREMRLEGRTLAKLGLSDLDFEAVKSRLNA
ncbi:MAG: NAD/NADP octopine/nopaline dehydrogenase family protein [Candidatus Obscuribacterales bacterium]|nr:NAD/NADP octopine/nopaline dehydrogenase family protein [Candidatus Obscuribacterales bacterium]